MVESKKFVLGVGVLGQAHQSTALILVTRLAEGVLSFRVSSRIEESSP